MSATTYYVDFAGGNDNNSGISASSPWRRCPGDVGAAGKAGSKRLAAGDVVRFKGGVAYDGTIWIRSSGSSSSPIVFDGNNSGTWGTGRAIIDRANQPGKRCFIANFDIDNIVIKGFELRNCGGYRDGDPILSSVVPVSVTPNGTAVDFTAGGHKNILLENLRIHRIGQWRNLPFLDGGNAITGTGIKLQNCNGFTIRKCNFSKMRNPISIKSTTLTKNVLVDDCDLHHYFVWGIDIAPRKTGAAFSNISIRDTKIRDYHQYDAGNWLGTGEKPHADGIFLRTANMESGWTNINIFNCEFYTDDPNNSQGGTASIYVSQGPSVNIYNNTFNRDRNSRAIGIIGLNMAWHSQTVRVYNNSFLNGPTHVSISGEPSSSRRKIYIQNNIFYRNEGSSTYIMINHQGGTFPVTLDRNIYFDPDYSETKRYVLYSVQNWYSRLSDLKAKGFEAYGRYVNPGYLDIDPVLNSQDDMRLEPGASASSGGANFSTLFQIDKAELPRPATGTWSVGAYTAGATSLSSSSLVPPTGLRLVALDD